MINNKNEFTNFLNFLPELNDGECYYVALFARKKYHESVTKDKHCLKRFTANSKEWLKLKINQLSSQSFTSLSGDPIHKDALALYISVNPRCLKTAQSKTAIELIKCLSDQENYQNPQAIALNSIHKSKSRSCFVDFDFDVNDRQHVINQVLTFLSNDSVKFLITRGGLHVLVDPKKASQDDKQWHKKIKNIEGCDVVGDTLIPVGGCSQGGFTPYLNNNNV